MGHENFSVFIDKLSGITEKHLVERINNVVLLELVNSNISFRPKFLGFPPISTLVVLHGRATTSFFQIWLSYHDMNKF
jgi:hypothetical protein